MYVCALIISKIVWFQYVVSWYIQTDSMVAGTPYHCWKLKSYSCILFLTAPTFLKFVEDIQQVRNYDLL